jgi:hypothetical protein
MDGFLDELARRGLGRLMMRTPPWCFPDVPKDRPQKQAELDHQGGEEAMEANRTMDEINKQQGAR